MKLLSSSRSSRHIGLVLFLISFVVVSGVSAIVWSGLFVLLRPPPFAWYWIVISGLAFGFFWCLIKPSRAEVLAAQQRLHDQAVTIPGHHPILGDVTHRPYNNSWIASPDLPNGEVVQLLGHGSAPSESEVRTWAAISANVASLVQKAEAVLLPCPDDPSPPPDVHLEPIQVELLPDGSFAIDFRSLPSSDDLHVWPGARYSANLELLSAAWDP
ncbi:MAG TPA: hypothetical protein VD994_00205 [Prosthecobacter sp.]|nr:hypothetical protein [Prosthecobacter sp.]